MIIIETEEERCWAEILVEELSQEEISIAVRAINQAIIEAYEIRETGESYE